MDTDTAARNKEVVRAVEEAWDRSDVGSLDQHFAPDFDNSQSAFPGLPPGLEGARMAHQASMTSFPDRKVQIEDMAAEGDKVWVRARITGTNQGGFANIPANGNPIDISFVGIYRLRDDKIVEHWGLNDAATLMQQLQGA